MKTDSCLFLVGDGIPTGALRGKRLAKLITALAAGKGQVELTALVEAGYRETMGGIPIDSLDAEMVRREAEGDFSGGES